MSPNLIPVIFVRTCRPTSRGTVQRAVHALRSTAIVFQRFGWGRCPIPHLVINSIDQYHPIEPGSMASPCNIMMKPGASQHGGDLFAYCGAGHYLPARVQKAARSHSNCNLKRHHTIKLLQSIQLASYHLQERWPCPFNQSKLIQQQYINIAIAGHVRGGATGRRNRGSNNPFRKNLVKSPNVRQHTL